MHKYYFKIKKNDTELEFATDNLDDFDTKVSEWVGVICPPLENGSINSSKQRMDFIEIKDLININKLTGKTGEEAEVAFDDILEESMVNPKIDLDNREFEETPLIQLFNERSPSSHLDVLILVCFYMIHFENINRISIKQINSYIVPIAKEPITHLTVQNAIDRGLLELIPDLTGYADVTEYALTQAGEEYYFNGF